MISRRVSGRVRTALAVLSACCCLAACGARPHTFAAGPPAWGGVARVAVIPFANGTAAPEASRVVTGAFIAGLVRSGRFRVEFQGTVRSFFIRERLVVRSGVDLKTLAMMRERLGVDAVVLGQVEEYAGTEEIRRAVIPRATISVRVVDTSSGRVLYMARHHRAGDDYDTVLGLGRVRTVGGLSRRMVEEMIEGMPPMAAGPDLEPREDRG